MDEPKKLVLCSCDKTINYQAKAFSDRGFDEIILVDQLCGTDLNIAIRELSKTQEVVFACEQQAHIFEQLTGELTSEDGLKASLSLLDLRDRAGWTAKGQDQDLVTAKQIALLEDAKLQRPGTPVKEVTSIGTCLIIGKDGSALKIAEALGQELAVTCVLEAAPERTLPSNNFDLATGKIRSISGGLGAFDVIFDQFASLVVTGRGEALFTAPRDGAQSACDIVIDLVSESSLLNAESVRDGYLRGTPSNETELAVLVTRAKSLVGTFEKPFYVKYESAICAHSRSQKIGCTRCIDTCGAKAIRSNGDSVYIDPDMCGGCGGCAAVCPTGAITYDDPPFEFMVDRLRTLIETYRSLSGRSPRVLFIDSSYGRGLIAKSARFSRGLPADVIPYEVDNVELIGHAELLTTLGAGANEVIILKSPKTGETAITSEHGLTNRLLDGSNIDSKRTRVIEANSIEDLESALYKKRLPEIEGIDTALLGSRREVTKQLMSAFTGYDGETPITIALEAGDPYGTIEVDTNKCTLCLACVSQCPTGALNDRSDRPEINIVENACVQCGLCANTCPETAITLKPQLSLGKHTLNQQMLHGEEPFDCIECGRPFGVKSTIERIIEKLDGKHWMYTDSDNTKLVKMCDDCRVGAQFHDENAPMKGAPRPRVRTTDDYLDS